MADFDEYESLPEDTPFHITATAGALAGIAEHVALYPVDSVKVRSNRHPQFSKAFPNWAFERFEVKISCLDLK